MKFRIRIILFIIFAFVLVEESENFFPSRRELSDLEITRIVALDEGINQKDVKLSILRDIAKGEGEGSNNGGIGKGGSSESSESAEQASQSKKEEVVSVEAPSFNTSIALLQNYTDKQFLGGHVRYVLIGESMVQNQLRRAMDFLGRDNETRLKTNMYIIKGMSADSFLTKAIGSDYTISGKLKNIGSKDNEIGLSYEVPLTDVTKLIIDKNASGVIPAIELVKNGQFFNDNKWSISSSKKSDNEYDFILAGYGIIKDSRLIGYLNLAESRGYNFTNNKVEKTIIEVGDEVAETKVILSVDNAKTKIKNDFEGDGLKTVHLDVEVNSDIVEIDSKESIFTGGKLEFYEVKQSEVIKNEIESMLRRTQDVNADILEIGAKIEREHPYKWRKIKDRWSEIYPKINFVVTVKSELERTYDLLESKQERGEKV